jgi:radical SAM protein with 4Fe4S-binding SPASM domain
MFDGFLISLHGDSENIHESFTNVPGSFLETIYNIQRVVRAGFDVSTSFVITAENWSRIEQTLNLVLGLGVNYMVCNRLIGKPIEGFSPSQAQLRKAIRTIEYLRQKNMPIRFGNCIPQCFESSSAMGCAAGYAFATIDPWGRVRPCNHAPLVVGNLLSESIESIWHNNEMEQWRSLVANTCLECPVFSKCGGGCRAQTILSNNLQDPLVPETVEQVSNNETNMLLYAGLRPKSQFTCIFEDGRVILVYKSSVAAVPDDFSPLLSRLDGTLTLQDISQEFGESVVNWIGALYRGNLVFWSSP